MKKTILLYSDDDTFIEKMYHVLSEKFSLIEAKKEKDLFPLLGMIDLAIIDLVSFEKEALKTVHKIIESHSIPLYLRINQDIEDDIKDIISLGINDYFYDYKELPVVVCKIKRFLEIRDHEKELKHLKQQSEISYHHKYPPQRTAISEVIQSDLRKVYQHRDALQKISEIVDENSNLENFLKRFLFLIKDVTQVSRIAIFLRDEVTGRFKVRSSIGFLENIMSEVTFLDSDPLIQYFTETGSILRKELLENSVKPLDLQILDWVQKFNIELIFPFIGDDLMSGFLVCNGKVTGLLFTDDEIEFMYSLVENAIKIISSNMLFYKAVDQKNKIESIIKNVSSGIIVVNNKEKITHCNNKASEILQFEKDVVGNDFSCLPSEITELIQIALQEGKNFHRQETFIQSINKYIGFGIVPVIDNNQKEGCIIIFTDITTIKRMQKEAKLTDKLDFLSRIAARSSHELKNCLVSIKTFTQLLPERYVDENFRKDFYQVVNHEVDRLDRLVESFVFFSKPIELQLRWIELSELINKSIDEIKDIDWKNIEISIEIKPEVQKINVDENQIENVIKNIILNAAQAISTQGKIEIKCDKIIDKENEIDWISISIFDNGSGIASDILEEVFEPFYTTKTRGIGLGLTIAKKVVEEHNGIINITSEKDKETKVTILLPFYEKPAEDTVHKENTKHQKDSALKKDTTHQ